MVTVKITDIDWNLSGIEDQMDIIKPLLHDKYIIRFNEPIDDPVEEAMTRIEDETGVLIWSAKTKTINE